jgi:predicted phage tail protein
VSEDRSLPEDSLLQLAVQPPDFDSQDTDYGNKQIETRAQLQKYAEYREGARKAEAADEARDAEAARQANEVQDILEKACGGDIRFDSGFCFLSALCCWRLLIFGSFWLVSLWRSVVVDGWRRLAFLAVEGLSLLVAVVGVGRCLAPRAQGTNRTQGP